MFFRQAGRPAGRAAEQKAASKWARGDRQTIFLDFELGFQLGSLQDHIASTAIHWPIMSEPQKQCVPLCVDLFWPLARPKIPQKKA